MARPIEGTRTIFVNFMVRDGRMTVAQARAEYDQYLTINGQAALRDYYLMVRRVGATICLNRAERRAVYETFCNAQNHAAFAAECAA